MKILDKILDKLNESLVIPIMFFILGIILIIYDKHWINGYVIVGSSTVWFICNCHEKLSR